MPQQVHCILSEVKQAILTAFVQNNYLTLARDGELDFQLMEDEKERIDRKYSKYHESQRFHFPT